MARYSILAIFGHNLNEKGETPKVKIFEFLQKFDQQWVSMVPLCLLVHFREPKASYRASLKEYRVVHVIKIAISVYKLCNVKKTESISVPSDPAATYFFVTTTYWITVG